MNALVDQRIARISATPGKTRAMNVYVVRGRWPVASGDLSGEPPDHRPQTTDHAFYLLDLPGYGYARASKPDRAAFARIVHHVLHRPRLSGVVWLLDIRHDPSAGDRAMQDLLAGAGTRVLAAVTKSDKLAPAQRRARETALRQLLAFDEDQVVLTSARSGLGIPELREAVAALARAG
ncbi:MAG: GTP-binding protein [Gemmatimonadota bacterium]